MASEPIETPICYAPQKNHDGTKQVVMLNTIGDTYKEAKLRFTHLHLFGFMWYFGINVNASFISGGGYTYTTGIKDETLLTLLCEAVSLTPCKV